MKNENAEKNENADMLRQMVRGRYAHAATGTGCGCTPHNAGGCCGSNSDSIEQVNRIMGYSDKELGSVIEGANLGLGCGNPTAIGELQLGDVVLDLGSGAGFDCFLAAQKVGEKGRVIGVDMTPEMLSKARKNAVKMGVANVEFRLGEIEHLPVADNSVDIIISNCVVNLSPEKQQVFKDACRVLKPGGRLFVSDVVATAEMPDSMREQAALITGCIAGAERTDRLRCFLEEAGFENVKIELKAHSKALVSGWFPGSGVEKYVSSADIRAVKPI
ncbi:arsenite methyltransferase [Desulfosarcina widdelii]|nr:arsenite methyltransferase [Desulfosarcina widdelii]